MLDWFTGLVGYDASALRLGQICAINRHGEIEWRKDRAEVVMGSFESKVLVGKGSSTPEMRDSAERLGLVVNPEVLWISGNPTKFLQGHNVFGPPVSSLGSMVRSLIRAFPGDVRPPDVDSDLWPALRRSRVDMATTIDLGSHASVHEWLDTAARSSRSRHRNGCKQMEGGTVYWGWGSRRWIMVAYCKLCELLHRPVAELKLYEMLKQYCEGKLRLELRLKRPELKGRNTLEEGLIWDYFEKISIGELEMSKVKDGRPNLRPTIEICLSLWLAGGDLKARLPKATFYKYRLEIMNETGIDISIPRSDQESTIERVKLDLDYLKAHELKSVPDHLQGWLFRPDACPSYGGG
jgi:hypothetical protein